VKIITYLPTGETTGADAIELDLLVASRDDLATLIGSLGADNVVIEEIPRRPPLVLAQRRAAAWQCGRRDVGSPGRSAFARAQ